MSEKLDPERVHQIMGGCFRVLLDEIHKYEGTIDKFTGDGVMALFGAPLAHEDHAQRACYAALSIRKAIEEYGESVKDSWGVEFKMRIGLNSGRVIVGSVGDDLRMDYTAIGDTTNMASRMETMARPGTILASGHTYRLARDFFEFTSVGKVPVKGKEESQETYELVTARGVETRIEASAAKGLTRFLGRRKEMGALREAFEKTRSGSGQVVGIVGDAGVGKSRLLREFRNTLPQAEHVFLAGSCLHYGASMVYLPILDILRSYFDIRVADEEEDIQKKVREALGRLNGALLGNLPPLQDVLSLTVEDEAYLQIDTQQRRQRVFEAIRDLLYHTSREKPLVLAMEDLHWIDRTSQDFLDFFADEVSPAQILLILLYRPEYSHARGAKSYCREIPLDQLSTKISADLVQAILEGGEVAPEIRNLILGKSGGNPLFVEELTSSLLENGCILRTDDRYVLSPSIAEIQVPDTVHGIIAARMDRLEENLKRIIQVASVIGREFAYRLLQTITGMRGELKASLLNLQGLELIHEKQLGPDLEYVFKHALTQEVAYSSLLSKIRSEIHGKIGTAIEQLFAGRLEESYELLAYHYVRSTNTAKAVEYLDLANQKAASANAMEDAKAYFDKALELVEALPETEETRERRVSLVVNQSNVFFLLLKFTEYHDLLVHYESLAARLHNPGVRGAFYARLGWYESTLGWFDQAIQTLTKAAQLRETAENTEEAGFLYLAQYVHMMKSDYDRAFELYEELLRAMEGIFNLRCYVRGLTAASQAYAHLGRWDEAVEVGERALQTAHDFSDVSMTAFAEVCLSAVYTFKRDLDQAIRYAEQALGRASTPGDRVMAQQFLGWALCHAGEPRKGIKILAGILPLYQATCFVMMELWCALFLADGYWLAGEYYKGKQTAEELLKIAERCGARYCTGYAHFLLGEMSLGNEPDQAATHLEKSIAVFQEIKAENVLAMAYAGYGRCHKQQGNVDIARGFLSRALEIFERLGTLIEPEKTRRELTTLTEEG